MPTELVKDARSKDEVTGLVAELERRSKSARDVIVPMNLLQARPLDSGVELSWPDIGIARTSVPMRDVAADQTAERLNIPTAYHRRMLAEAPALWAENVNVWSGRDGRNSLLRLLDGRVRAHLSDRYRVLDDYDLFFGTAKIAMEAGAEVSRVTLTEDRFEMRILHPEWREDLVYPEDGTDPDRHRVGRATGVMIPGMYVRNSQTGKGALSVAPFLLDLVCNNGLIMETGMAQIHLGGQNSLGELESTETRAIADQLLWAQVGDATRGIFDREKFAALVKGIGGVGAEKLEHPIDAVNVVVKSFGFSDDDRQAILNELISPTRDIDPGRTVFGLLSAITARAKQYTADPERQSDMEAAAGKLLREPQMVRVR